MTSVRRKNKASWDDKEWSLEGREAIVLSEVTIYEAFRRKTMFLLYSWHILSTEKLRHVNFKNKKGRLSVLSCDIIVLLSTIKQRLHYSHAFSSMMWRKSNQVLVNVYKTEIMAGGVDTVEAHHCWKRSLAKVQVAIILCLLKIDGLFLLDRVLTKPWWSKIMGT